MRTLLLILLSCQDAKLVCEPGETQICVCATGEAGAQTCDIDGESWDACACTTDDDDEYDDDEHEDEEDEEDEEEDDTGFSPAGGDATAGEAIYGSACASCHGATGRGTAAGPDLSDEVPEMSDGEIAEVITEGEDDMPAIALSATEIADVIAWLRARFGREEEEDDD